MSGKETKKWSLISHRIQFAVMLAVGLVVAGAMIVLSASLHQLSGKATEKELSSVAYLALETIKNADGGDYSYDGKTGRFYSGDWHINYDRGFIDRICEKTGCFLEIYWGRERILSGQANGVGQKKIWMENDYIWGKISNGEKVFLYDMVIDNEPYCAVYLPVTQPSDGKVVGILSVGKPMKSFYQLTNNTEISSAVILLILAIVCSVALLMFMSGATHSITELNAQVDSILLSFSSAEPDLTLRVNSDRKDEVGLLAHSFNVFLIRLESKMRKCRGYAENLTSYIADTQRSIDSLSEKPGEEKTIDELRRTVREAQRRLDALKTMSNYLSAEFDKYNLE